MKSWLVIIVICMLHKNSEGQFTCDPVIDCKNAEVLDLVPDPEDCTKYYICVLLPPDNHLGPSAVTGQCQSGMYFDQYNASCINGSEPCRNICPPKNYCTTKCPMQFDDAILVASKIDCTHFKVCGNESEILLRCSVETPYFNGVKCVVNETQCCDFCTPYCSQIDLPIQDPCSCNRFYNCSEIGQIIIGTTSIPCNSGEYFDEESGQCKNGTCSSSCPACTVTDAPTTFTTTEFTTGPPRSDPAFNKEKRKVDELDLDRHTKYL